ncbi:hypothetical protein Tco_0927204 [Tanacetum coccineum]
MGQCCTTSQARENEDVILVVSTAEANLQTFITAISDVKGVRRAAINDNGTVWVMGRVVRADLWARLYTLWRTPLVFGIVILRWGDEARFTQWRDQTITE